MLQGNYFFPRIQEIKGMLQDIFQLPDIPRPAIAGKKPLYLRIQAPDRLVVACI
ncbi:hypothetical protein [Neomoorella thermoacetica]|uniref:hypothetical protein n=1 Tax=Neomoorella thermoacetica TaxID=1525 RepID=UPI0016532469|nr:hypothetical protein [Moorella thermoacetica]